MFDADRHAAASRTRAGRGDQGPGAATSCWPASRAWAATTARSPGLLAEMLDLPQVTVAVKVEVQDGKAVVEREIEGAHETWETTLPAVISAQKGLNEPRYASLKGIMAAKKKTDRDQGRGGAGPRRRVLAPRARVVALELPAARAAVKMIEGDPETQAQGAAAAAPRRSEGDLMPGIVTFAEHARRQAAAALARRRSRRRRRLAASLGGPSRARRSWARAPRASPRSWPPTARTRSTSSTTRPSAPTRPSPTPAPLAQVVDRGQAGGGARARSRRWARTWRRAWPRGSAPGSSSDCVACASKDGRLRSAPADLRRQGATPPCAGTASRRWPRCGPTCSRWARRTRRARPRS